MRRGKLEKTGSAMEFELGISKAAFPRSAPEFWFSGAVRDADRLVGLDADPGADAGLAPVDVEPGVFASPLTCKPPTPFWHPKHWSTSKVISIRLKASWTRRLSNAYKRFASGSRETCRSFLGGSITPPLTGWPTTDTRSIGLKEFNWAMPPTTWIGPTSSPPWCFTN